MEKEENVEEIEKVENEEKKDKKEDELIEEIEKAVNKEVKEEENIIKEEEKMISEAKKENTEPFTPLETKEKENEEKVLQEIKSNENKKENKNKDKLLNEIKSDKKDNNLGQLTAICITEKEIKEPPVNTTEFDSTSTISLLTNDFTTINDKTTVNSTDQKLNIDENAKKFNEEAQIDIKGEVHAKFKTTKDKEEEKDVDTKEKDDAENKKPDANKDESKNENKENKQKDDKLTKEQIVEFLANISSESLFSNSTINMDISPKRSPFGGKGCNGYDLNSKFNYQGDMAFNRRFKQMCQNSAHGKNIEMMRNQTAPDIEILDFLLQEAANHNQYNPNLQKKKRKSRRRKSIGDDTITEKINNMLISEDEMSSEKEKAIFHDVTSERDKQNKWVKGEDMVLNKAKKNSKENVLAGDSQDIQKPEEQKPQVETKPKNKEKKKSSSKESEGYKPKMIEDLREDSKVLEYRQKNMVKVEGFMWKKRRIFSCFWHQKYFCLLKNGFLVYHKADGSKFAKGNWNIANLEMTKRYAFEEKHPYRIVMPDEMFFGFDSQEERDYWHKKIVEVQEKLKDRPI